MSRVVHFEIHAENPQRAIKFYEAVLGWQFNQWGGQDYWIITTGPSDQPGIDGGLLSRQGTIDGQAVIAYVCTADVASFFSARRECQISTALVGIWHSLRAFRKVIFRRSILILTLSSVDQVHHAAHHLEN